MGVLAKGRYTYGNKDWDSIKDITGANVGDTVFDTTFSKERIFDGNNFVHGNAKSIEYEVGEDQVQVEGYILTTGGTSNNTVVRTTFSTEQEVVIGFLEDDLAGATFSGGEIIPVCYHGLTLMTVPSGFDPGDMIQASTVTQGLMQLSSAGAGGNPGDSGIWIDDTTTVTSTGLGIFKPVERF